MRKYSITLTLEERKILENKLNSEKLSMKQKNKIKVILLKSEKKSIDKIIQATKLSKRTIHYYISEYIDNKYIFNINKYVDRCELNKYSEIIITEFKNKPPFTYKEAKQKIEELTGLKRSETQIRAFLNKKRIYSLVSNYINYNNKKTYTTRGKHIYYRDKIKLYIIYRDYKLNKYYELLLNEFKNNPPITYNEATQRVKKLTGLKRSKAEIKKFLDKEEIYTPKSRKNKENNSNNNYNDDDFFNKDYINDDFSYLDYNSNSYYPY